MRYDYYLPVYTPVFSLKALAESIFKFSSGTGDDFVKLASGKQPTAMTYAPMEVKQRKMSYGFSSAGFGLTGSGKMDFHLPWNRVSMVDSREEISAEIEGQQQLGLKAINLIWTPEDISGFEKEYPPVRKLWREDWECYSGVLYRAPEIPLTYGDRIKLALEYFENRS